METYHSSIINLQEDEIPLIFQDFSTSDIGLDDVLYPNNPPKIDGKNYGDNNMSAAGYLLESENTACATNNEDQSEKKILHKEIERQRRKEMAALYHSLRSLLPSKSIKGKRSASDQIHEATEYIRFMQNKVRQLEMKRDKMKKWREVESLGSSSKTLPITVTVQRCSVGVEVLISCAESRSLLRLSRILQLLLEEGLDVIDCNCTKYNGGLHYVIHSEVVSCSSMDLQTLQRKLTSGIENLNCISF